MLLDTKTLKLAQFTGYYYYLIMSFIEKLTHLDCML